MGPVQRHIEHLRRLGIQVDDIGNPNQQLRPMSDFTPSFAQQTPAGFNPPPTFAPRPSFAPSQSFASPSDFAMQPMQAQTHTHCCLSCLPPLRRRQLSGEFLAQ